MSCIQTWVLCTVHRTHKPIFSEKFSLKMGHTALFTHLKIILLQCFQFSVISSIQTGHYYHLSFFIFFFFWFEGCLCQQFFWGFFFYNLLFMYNFLKPQLFSMNEDLVKANEYYESMIGVKPWISTSLRKQYAIKLLALMCGKI